MLHKNGKAIPLQAWTGPQGSRRLKSPDFLDMWHMKILRLSTLRAGRLYHQEIPLVLSSLIVWVYPMATVRPERLIKRNIPRTTSEIEPMSFRFIKQCTCKLHTLYNSPLYSAQCPPSKTELNLITSSSVACKFQTWEQLLGYKNWPWSIFSHKLNLKAAVLRKTRTSFDIHSFAQFKCSQHSATVACCTIQFTTNRSCIFPHILCISRDAINSHYWWVQ